MECGDRENRDEANGVIKLERARGQIKASALGHHNCHLSIPLVSVRTASHALWISFLNLTITTAVGIALSVHRCNGKWE